MVPFFNMTAKDISTSKTMFGALVLIGVGGYLIYKGQYELGVMAIGNGMAVAGVRDKLEKNDQKN